MVEETSRILLKTSQNEVCRSARFTTANRGSIINMGSRKKKTVDN